MNDLVKNSKHLKKVALEYHIRAPLLYVTSYIDEVLNQVKTFEPTAQLFDIRSDLNQQKNLGKEALDCIIIFNAKTPLNLLIALLGMIKGGSLIIFLYDQSAGFNRFYEKFLFKEIEKIEELLRLDRPFKHYTKATFVDMTNLKNEVLLRLQSKNTNIAHIIGQRGRGKSTLLGNIASDLISAGQRVLLASPSRSSSEKTLNQILNVSRETFAYLPPEKILANYKNFDAILIDEAASLSAKIIQEIINQKEKLALLATTVEGYESKGQGFRLDYLEDQNTYTVELTRPLRFSENDPLEALLNTLCGSHIQKTPLNIKDGMHQFVTNQIHDFDLLLGCYYLLRDAHYKTSPNDLVDLVNQRQWLFLFIKNQQVMSVALAIDEKIDNQQLAEAIFYGLRRPKGAMALQGLVYSYGCFKLIGKRYLRVKRIATTKSQRRKHLASNLLLKIIGFSESDFDGLLVSFSATDINIRFWLQQKFKPLRLSQYKNKWNNCHSITMGYAPDDHLSHILDRFNLHYSFYSSYYDDIALKHINICTMPKKENSIQQEIMSVLSGRRDIFWSLPYLHSKRNLLTELIPVNEKKQLLSLLEPDTPYESQKKENLKKLLFLCNEQH